MGKNWAITIGINNYDNLQPLRYAQRDAEAMKDWFQQEARFKRVFLFTDNSEPIYQVNPPIPTTPTFGHLRRFLRAQFERPLLKPEDNLWFFFAGHGKRHKDKDYLMLSDSDPGDVEHTAISVEYVTQRLRRSGAGNVVLFLDACREKGSRGGLGIGEEKHQGVITFYSCTANQLSWEIEELQHGSFTHTLLEGLRLQEKFNCATVERLNQHLIVQVPKLNKLYGREVQKPYLKAEPPYKMYFILLEQYATLKDVEPLKSEAYKAELEGNLPIAEQLWIRVLAVSPGDLDAIAAIQRIAVKKAARPQDSSQETVISTSESEALQRGEGKEVLSRRFEAAMPQESRVGQMTEVRVMISLPDSLGLKNYLPDWTESGDLIAKKDVVENDVPLEFPINPATNQLQPGQFWIGLSAPDFDILESTKSIFLDPRKNSGVITFFLTPNVSEKHRRVVVELFKDEKKSILLTSLTLITDITTKQDEIIKIVWQIVTLPLAIVPQFQTEKLIVKQKEERQQREEAERLRRQETDRLEQQEAERLGQQQSTIMTPSIPITRKQFLKWVGLGSSGLVTAVVAREIFQQPPLTLEPFDFEVKTVNAEGKVIEQKKSQAKFFKEDLGNGVPLEMVSIPGGKFLMGTEDEEIERLVQKFNWNKFRREKLQHEVTVQPFFMGKYPITQAQWRAIASLPKVNRNLEPDPSHSKGDDRPVEQVSWDEAVEFCQRLSKATEREYRLPSEAEWEYACRAGTTTPFHFGETITSELANYRASKTYANEPEGEYREQTTPVGNFPPNAFGLYDMHGNVWEWCEDDWHNNYQSAPTDGSAWRSGNSNIKVIRGGSWYLIPWYCRSATRYNFNPEVANRSIGFRVVCVATRTT